MEIEISRISLDVENFRHKKVASERQAMQAILTDEKAHKISDLAHDIVAMGGLDPSSLLIVTQDPEDDGNYIALEGNRRITALKALASPEIAAGTASYSVFKRLSGRFLALGITKVECIVLERKLAFQWIKRKHYNGMGGRGVVQWNALATARSDASEGKVARWMAALTLLDDNGVDTNSLFEDISGKTTTVERVLVSPDVKSVLGLNFERSGSVSPENGDVKAACTLIAALLAKMGERDFSEPKVTNAELQKEFIAQFSHLSVSTKRSPRGAGAGDVVSTPLESSDGNDRIDRAPSAGDGTSLGQSNQPLQQSEDPNRIARSKPIRQRKYLAQGGLRISNVSLNRLYGELKKLNVETNPHIASAMIRIFLEKATMVFLQDLHLPCPNPKGWSSFDVRLRDKVSSALQKIDPGKNNGRLSYARDIANGVSDKLHTLDLLNRAIHDNHALPSTLEVSQIWDRYQPYLESLFKELENNGK